MIASSSKRQRGALAKVSRDQLNQRMIERSKESFRFFVRQAWSEIEPGVPLEWSWFMDALCEHLQAVYTRDITRLLINIAPGHGKSSFVSVLFTVWCWLNDPTIRWLCASHSLDLAIRDNRNARRLIESEWFQSRFGDVFSLAGDQNVKSFFENDHTGYRMAVGVRGSGTGKRGTHLLIDDPHNAMEGELERKACIEWFGKTWMSRLNDQAHGPMIVVGQRLHHEDLSSHILQLGGWEHLCLPEEYESARKSVTCIGWSDPRTQDGELLWPERFNHTVLQKLKEGLGAFDYAAQYQQTPVPSSGGKFQEKWFRYYSLLYRVDESGQSVANAYLLHGRDGDKTIPVQQCWRFGTVDLAISSKESADYTVFAVWDVTPDNDLLLHKIVRGHFTNAEQLAQLDLLYRTGVLYWKIETVAYQQAFLQQGIAAGIPCREYNPRHAGDKVVRSSPFAVWMQNGKVYFPHPAKAAWMADVATELIQFPRGKHDDIVDVCSMAADEVVAPRGPVVWSPDDAGTPATPGTQQPPSQATRMVEIERPAAPPPAVFWDEGRLIELGGDDAW